jgi:RNAse (barnase) inhibitor barstar
VYLDEVIDAENPVIDEDSLFHALDRSLEFPDYFGYNWNAVDECLSDMSWRPSQGYCLVFLNPNTLCQRDMQVFELFLEVVKYASDCWSKEGIPFKLILPSLSEQEKSSQDGI